MKLKYIKIEQPIGTIYLASVKANVLLSWTNINHNNFFNSVVRNKSEQLQIKEISLFSKNSDAVFPTPIVICIDNPNDVKIGYDFIDIPDNISNFAEILDGHHRLLGISHSGNSNYFELSVAIMFNLTKEEKAYIFSAINSNQRSAPNSQIYNLYDVTENRSPCKTAHLVARALNNIEESPFYRRLKMMRDYNNSINYNPITQSLFVESILKLITNDEVGDANKLTKGSPLTPDDSLQLRSYFINNQDVNILQIMYDCFSALKEVFPKEWSSPQEFTLWQTSGFVGVMGAMNDIIKKGKEQNTLDKQFFKTIFDNLKKYLGKDGIPKVSDILTTSILRSNDLYLDVEFNNMVEELFIIGEKERNNGNYRNALECYSDAIKLNPYFSEAYCHRGISYQLLGDFSYAHKDYNMAIKNDPNNAEAYLNRGILNYQKGNLDEAAEDFDHAIAKKSNYAEAFYIRGLFRYVRYFNNEDAINDIIHAKAIKNDVVEAYIYHNLLTGMMKELDNSFNGVCYSKDMKKLVIVPKNKLKSFIIPSFVTEIGNSAFDGCSSLESIEIPDSVTKIGNFAFSGCSSLTSIVIPENVTKIGDFVFSGCSSLTSIVIPNSLTEIGHSAFHDCTSLTSIVIPENVTKIREFAFSGCSSLTSIEIPDSVTEIACGVFAGCTNHVELHLRHKMPIDLSGSLLDVDLSKITIYVPKGSSEAYRKHEFYKGFKDIIEE